MRVTNIVEMNYQQPLDLGLTLWGRLICTVVLYARIYNILGSNTWKLSLKITLKPVLNIEPGGPVKLHAMGGVCLVEG